MSFNTIVKKACYPTTKSVTPLKMQLGKTEREGGFVLVLSLGIMFFVLLLLMTLVSLEQVVSGSSQTQRAALGRASKIRHEN